MPLRARARTGGRASQWACVGSGRPNGSRLSCGASAGGRKRPVLRYLRAGAQTYASFESRPRQLQALVRQPAFTRNGGAANSH